MRKKNIGKDIWRLDEGNTTAEKNKQTNKVSLWRIEEKWTIWGPIRV